MRKITFRYIVTLGEALLTLHNMYIELIVNVTKIRKFDTRNSFLQRYV